MIKGINSISIDSITDAEEPFVAHPQERDPIAVVTAVARVSFEGEDIWPLVSRNVFFDHQLKADPEEGTPTLDGPDLIVLFDITICTFK